MNVITYRANNTIASMASVPVIGSGSAWDLIQYHKRNNDCVTTVNGITWIILPDATAIMIAGV